MASLDDLKKRIASVKSTQKITKAMKMVAAAKLRRAQESAERGRPYSEKMNNIILNLSNGISDKENAPKLLSGTGENKIHLCVVMTSDRGLCGGFNSNIIKKAKSYFSKILNEGKQLKIITVGSKGNDQLKRVYGDKIVENIDGIVLAGGSAFGLDASSGVMDCLRSQNRGFDTGAIRVPIVPSAILFDLKNGGFKEWEMNPYRELGQNAFLKVSDDFEIGSAGAGCGATTSVVKGGLGTSSIFYGHRIKVGAIVAVNSVCLLYTSDAADE